MDDLKAYKDNWLNLYFERKQYGPLYERLSGEEIWKFMEKEYGFWAKIVKLDSETNQSQDTGNNYPPLIYTGGIDGLVRELADQALKLMPLRCRNELKSMPIGTISVAEPSSYYKREPEGAENIIVHEGLILFVHYMSRIIVGAVGYTIVFQLAGWEVNEEEHFLYMAQKSFFLCLHILRGSIELRKYTIKLNPLFDILAVTCTHTCELFIILHEYAHVLLKRNVISLLDFPSFLRSFIAEHQLSDEQIEELCADAWAGDLLMKWRDSLFQGLGIPWIDDWVQASPCIFLAMLKFLENVKDFIGEESGPKDKYPTIELRRKVQCQIMEKALRDGVKYIVALSDDVWSITRKLWQFCERKLDRKG